jgi:hypothetical protein
MEIIPYLAIALLIGVVIGFLIGTRHAWPRAWVAGHYAGQLDMKERIRKEINDNVDAGKFAVRFHDGQDLSAEQMLQFMCHQVAPDAADATRGKAAYTP